MRRTEIPLPRPRRSWLSSEARRSSPSPRLASSIRPSLVVTRITPGISRPLPASLSPPTPSQELTPQPPSTTIQL
ncbi:hypothetical protein CERSUDRAFT_101605 [Gelatoporia subvermispora B]|uniref:Uncharacterized protein n=1 Tax=Ceriporiopsis subvermispora (strain B) TaxID=914234 RepID=M2QE37_CERS8|nr:hypothetical protein CERSUDRAFT_101605 [Gelatoporia subvermispora B]